MIHVTKVGANCTVTPTHQFQVGDVVTFEMKNKINYTIPHSLLRTDTANETSIKFPYTFTVTNSSRSLVFRFLYLKGVERGYLQTIYKGGAYVTSQCQTVIIPEEPVSGALSEKNKEIILYTLGTIVIIIMMAQSACILYYRSKAKELDRHSSLIKRSDDMVDTTDRERYSANPVDKKAKISQPIEEDIYEVPDITKCGLPMPPSVPSTPRPNLAHPGSVFSTLRSNTSTLRSNATTNHPTFPRPTQKSKPYEQDTLPKMSIANRPPLPLPDAEVYTDPDDDNTYEPPPIVETPTVNIAKPRPTPQKLPGKLPKFDIPLQPFKPQTTPRPTVSAKPYKPPISQAKPPPPRNNEPKISPARKNPVIQVPVRPIGPAIPGPSSLRRVPQPPISKPQPPPPPEPEPPRHYDHHGNEDSDEEWTYEPLPPYNIYSM
ncbi:uncharacterized protein LOC142984762 isoform X2 [Anticarsia gemmatalis]